MSSPSLSFEEVAALDGPKAHRITEIGRADRALRFEEQFRVLTAWPMRARAAVGPRPAAGGAAYVQGNEEGETSFAILICRSSTCSNWGPKSTGRGRAISYSSAVSTKLVPYFVLILWMSAFLNSD